MVAHLAKVAIAEDLALHRGLERCAAAIEKTAKSEIGSYQPAAGPFPAWAELTEATKADRVRQGYTENDPLERTHALEESISHQTHGLDAAIGSTSDVMVYQEMGTPTIPPRPVLGPAAVRNKELIHKTLGAAAVEGLLYGADSAFTALE